VISEGFFFTRKILLSGGKIKDVEAKIAGQQVELNGSVHDFWSFVLR
jgi:hypothetical protein